MALAGSVPNLGQPLFVNRPRFRGVMRPLAKTADSIPGTAQREGARLQPLPEHLHLLETRLRSLEVRLQPVEARLHPAEVHLQPLGKR